MIELRSIFLLSIVFVFLWVSAIGLLYLIDVMLFKYLEVSLLRSIIGMILFTLWLAACALFLIILSRKIIRNISFSYKFNRG